MRILKNKNGMAYVLTCAVTVVIMMLLAVLFQYRFLASVVRTQREEAQMKLDSVVMKSAVENYDALKQGIAYGDHIDYEKMVRAFPTGIRNGWRIGSLPLCDRRSRRFRTEALVWSHRMN